MIAEERRARSVAGSRAAVVGAALVAGLLATAAGVLRWWMIAGWAVNADQAVVGIMAGQIRRGETFTFYLGQDYGGVEPYVVAAVQILSPNDVLAVNLTPALLAAAAAVVVGLLVRHLAGGWAGLVAGVTTWVWPGLGIIWSTRQSGFRGITLLSGVVVLALTLRLVRERPGRPGHWLSLGVVGGIGFWSSPEAAYFLLPAAVGAAAALALVGRRDRTTYGALARRALLAVGGFALGALPWLWTNLSTGWQSLDASGVATTTYVERVRIAVRSATPLILGLRHPGGDWLVGRGVAAAMLLAAAVVVGGGAVLLVRRRPEASVLVLAILLFPFVYAVFPTSSFWLDGRYAVYLPPLLLMVAVPGWAGWLASRRELVPRLAVAVAGTTLAVAMVASGIAVLDRTHGVRSFDWSRLEQEPNAVAYEAIDGLAELGVTTAYADYWVSYTMTFLADGALAVDPVGQVRWDEAHERVVGSDRPAWLFVRPERLGEAAFQFWQPAFHPPVEALLSYLDATAIAYDDVEVGVFRVIIPERRVTPQDVGLLQAFRERR